MKVTRFKGWIRILNMVLFNQSPFKNMLPTKELTLLDCQAKGKMGSDGMIFYQLKSTRIPNQLASTRLSLVRPFLLLV